MDQDGRIQSRQNFLVLLQTASNLQNSGLEELDHNASLDNNRLEPAKPLLNCSQLWV